ncbi:transcriptional regulator [Aquimarina addita]|uniref:Transcriptional regulator n=2 Tax=Aquimarina addita TaxID=870485 RepID=A0ABP6USQ0_9FLAO
MGYDVQSWDITQDEDGLIYIANGNAILIFDGSVWKSVHTGDDIVNRSLFVKNRDSIYFGSDGRQGLLVNNKYDSYSVLPINNSSRDAVADIEEYWRTHYIDKHIVFQTFKNLYVNQGKIITKIPAPYRFKWSYEVDGVLYVNDLKYGVFRLEGTNLIPVVSDDHLNENIVGITKIDDDLIIITDTKGLYRFKEGQLMPIEFNKSEELKKAQIFSFLKLKDDKIAIGTVSNGLYLLDLKTAMAENLNKRNGLQNNTVLSIFQDSEGNLWLALDYGVDYIKLNSPLKYFYDYYGELGTVYAILAKEKLSYLGTNQGLYAFDNNLEGATTSFELLLNGQVWNIENVGDRVFIGHDKGAYVVEDTELTKLGEDLGAWNFRVPKGYKEDLIISGNYNGVSLYEYVDGQWQAHTLKGFEQSARYLEIDKNNNIWVALRSEGVFRFTLDYKAKELIDPVFYPIDMFGKKTVTLSKVDGNIMLTSDYKMFTYNVEKGIFEKGVMGQDRGFAPKIIKKDDHIYYLENNRMVVENHDKVLVLEELKDQLITDVLHVFSIDEKHEVVPVFNGFAMFTKNYDTAITGVNNDLLIRSFVSVDNNKVYGDGSKIPYRDNDLKINYSLPIYGEEVLYSTKINDDDWSEWTLSTEQALYNLREGNYSFKIKTKYGAGFKSTALHFTIEPPIYRTVWAYLSYLILFLTLIFVVRGINGYKLKKQERILLEQKAIKLSQQEEKYKAQELEREREIIELNNTKLQNEIKAKNRELTQIAYVNLNKNKILKKIRDKITKIQASSPEKLPANRYNELIRLVEYYITDKESEIFEINFDKSHQEFYRKLSKAYPSLTSKDLRLCAYLKMNLSSKEIAPLLGISSQSVDVSRHRLRKKLNLGSRDNLTNILISLT